MDTAANTLVLVQKALSELETSDAKLSNVLKKCIRIARLENDYENLLWLENEMIGIDDSFSNQALIDEVSSRYTKNEFQEIARKCSNIITSVRHIRELEKDELVDKGNICGLSVPEIERRIDTLHLEIDKMVVPSNLHTLDAYYANQSIIKSRRMCIALISEFEDILKRIEYCVHRFLSATEKRLIYGQIHTDIFERNRQYVDQHLKIIAPEVLGQFISAYKRLNERDSESRSQALLSCRRILKSVADALYPPPPNEILGGDGRTRKLTDEKFIARLWQYLHERIKGSSSGELLLMQVEDIGKRLDKLHALSSKGVHANVSDFEVNQCVIQTYLVVGDILCVKDQTSTIK